MQKIVLIQCLVMISYVLEAQPKPKLFEGMYIQWGYNKEWYTKSDIHIKMSNGNNFTLHKAKAHDSPDMDAILESPAEISIPQYNYRIGFYLNKNQSKAIELNFDHIKYVLTKGQKLRVTGQIDKQQVNGDSILNENNFLHMEHSDGGNLLHINYVQQNTLLTTRKTNRKLISAIWKLGAGINIPRTDFTYKGDRLNNKFHISGYNISVEGGARTYATRKLFIEFMGKAGFVNYINALANTKGMKGNRINHHFGYFELIGTLGYDINF